VIHDKFAMYLIAVRGAQLVYKAINVNVEIFSSSPSTPAYQIL
jgi:hypothetical protein